MIWLMFFFGLFVGGLIGAVLMAIGIAWEQTVFVPYMVDDTRGETER